MTLTTRTYWADKAKCEARLNRHDPYEGLSDEDKFILCVYGTSRNDYIAYKRYVAKELGWTEYKVAKVAKKLVKNRIVSIESAIHENGGYAGRGYWVNYK